MPVKKSSSRKVNWFVFWLLVLCSVTLVVAIFGSSGVKSLWSPRVSNEETGSGIQLPKPTTPVTETESYQSTMFQEKPKGRLMVDFYPAFRGECPDLDVSTSTMTVPYTTPHYKASMNVPYSFAWGNEEYAVSPYHYLEPGMGDGLSLDFGPIIPYMQSNGLCNPERDASITIEPKASSATLENVRRIYTNPGTGQTSQEQAKNMRERSINGLTVLSFDVVINDNTYFKWLAFGRTYNYQISSEGWLTDAEAIKIIQSLRVTK